MNKIYKYSDFYDFYYVVEEVNGLYRAKWIYSTNKTAYIFDSIPRKLNEFKLWQEGDVETEWTKDEISEFLLFMNL